MKKLVAVLIVSSLAMPALAQNTFHGNVARTGVFRGGAPAKPPAVKWSFKTGGPIVGSAAIADGVVYVASLSSYLYALDQQSGAKKWEFKSRMPIASSPAIADGFVYFVSSTGALAAIDSRTGQPAWVFPGEFEKKFEAMGLHGYPNAGQVIPDAWDIYTSSPAVANGKVYFGTGDGNVYAVDAKSGILQWKFTTGDVVHAAAAVVGNTVFIGSYEGNFYALDAEMGAQKWVFEAGRDAVMHNQVGFQSSAAVVDGTVYVGCRDAHVYALDAVTGRKKWDYPTSKSWVNTTPAVRGGIVYAGTSDSSRFMALDARTGGLRWVFDAKAYVFSSPALAGDLAIFGSFNGRLYAVNAATGALAWEFQIEAARQDRMKLLNPDGSLNQDAFAPVFGDFQDMYVDFYRYVSIGAIVASPVVDHGVVYVGSMDGNVYALN